MPEPITRIIFRRGTEIERDGLILNQGEPGYTIDTKRLYVGDGSTIGGIPVGTKFLGLFKFGINSTNIPEAVYPQVNDLAYDTTTSVLYALTGNQPKKPTSWIPVGVNIQGDNTTILKTVDTLSVKKGSLNGNFFSDLAFGRGIDRTGGDFSRDKIRLADTGQGLGFDSSNRLQINNQGVTNNTLALMGPQTVKGNIRDVVSIPTDVTLVELANVMSPILRPLIFPPFNPGITPRRYDYTNGIYIDDFVDPAIFSIDPGFAIFDPIEGITFKPFVVFTSGVALSSTLTVSQVAEFKQSIIVSGGNATVTGDALIGGNIVSNDRITITANGADITGDTIIRNSLTVKDNIDTDGRISCKNGLLISGNGASVTGDTSITGEVIINKKLTVNSGGISIIGASTISGSLRVTNGIEINNGGATIAGNTFITGPLTVSGVTNMSDTLTITDGGLVVGQGNATFAGTVRSTNRITGDNGLTITNAGANITGILTVQSGIIQAQAGITVTGVATFNNGLNVGANGATIIGNSTITGVTTISNGLLRAQAGLEVTGTILSTGRITGQAGLSILASGANITGIVSIAGNTSIAGEVNISQGSINASQGASIQGGVSVTGGLTSSSGNITSNGSLIVRDSVTVQGNNGVGADITGTTTITGQLRVTDDIVAYFSDKRLKTVVGGIENALEKVTKLNGVIFTTNDLAAELGIKCINKPSVGLLAQDVQSVLPEAVQLAPFDITSDNTSKSGENYLAVQYEKLIPLLVEAVKQIQDKLSVLETKINDIR